MNRPTYYQTAALQRQDSEASISTTSSIFDTAASRAGSPALSLSELFSDTEDEDLPPASPKDQKNASTLVPTPPVVVPERRLRPWLLLACVFISIIFVTWWACLDRSPPPLQLDSIARATFYHASMSNDLVGSISALQDSCTEEQLPTMEVNQLKNLVIPFDSALADKLQQAASAISRLREDLDQPALIVSVHLKPLENSLVYMARLLSVLRRSPTRNLKLEGSLEFYVDTYLSDEMRFALGQLRSALEVALQRCDTVMAAKQAVLDHFPTLLRPMGLIKPWFVSKRRWENNLAVIESHRIVRATFEVFQRVEALRASIEGTRYALSAYQDAPFIFEHVRDLPPLGYITNATMDHFMVRLHETLPGLSQVTQQVLSRRLM